MPCFLKFQRNNQQPDSGMESASEKLEKKAVFPSYCGCERITSEMKQSHLMAELKYILCRHDMFLPYESLPQQQGNNIWCNCR